MSSKRLSRWFLFDVSRRLKALPLALTVMMPLQKGASMRKISILLVGVALSFLLVACGSGGSYSSGSDSSQPVQPSGQSAPTQPAAPSTPTVFTFNGNGPQNTQLFTVKGPIEIDYQCEPSAMGNFVIEVYNDAGGDLGRPVNIDCNSGTTTGTAQSDASGSLYLVVTAMGNWSITVKGSQ